MAPGTSLRILASAPRAKPATSGVYLSRKESSCRCASAGETSASVFILRVLTLAITHPCHFEPSEAQVRNLLLAEVRGLTSALLLRPLIYPVIHRLVPKLRILRLLHPVPLIRKIQHLRRHAFHLQRGEQIESLRNVQPVVALPMNHESRRLEILGVLVRRPLLVAGTVVVGSAFELPVVKPQFFSRAPRGFRIEHAIVRDQALEAVGVPHDPVDHVSA